jgi:hypothetical protein
MYEQSTKIHVTIFSRSGITRVILRLSRMAYGISLSGIIVEICILMMQTRMHKLHVLHMFWPRKWYWRPTDYQCSLMGWASFLDRKDVYLSYMHPPRCMIYKARDCGIQRGRLHVCRVRDTYLLRPRGRSYGRRRAATHVSCGKTRIGL